MGVSDPLRSPRSGARLFPLAPAHLIGLGALQLALVLVWFEPWWAALPLVAFVGLMGLAAFFPRWRLFLPVVSRGRAADRVALTFDDGPDPQTTDRLLDLLQRHGVVATFFVVGRRVDAAPGPLRRALAAGCELGNHSADHDPWLMLRRRRRMRRSLADCQRAVAALGVRPLVFRPPAWVVNPGLWRVLLEQGLICVVANRRGLDFGNRRLRGLADRLLARVRGGDILALHDRRPAAAAGVERWLAEVDRLLSGLAERGLRPVALSELLQRPVMESLEAQAPAPGAVRAFYDGLAAGYDAEQDRGGQRGVRRVERELVERGIDDLLDTDGRVLELGAGTGRFSRLLAARSAQLWVQDLSPAMLAALEAKLEAAGTPPERVLAGDLAALELDVRFDLICAFSVLEYLPALEPLLARLAGMLAPGGRLWFTTAHRGPLRLVAQLGNAMRQGVWLRARSRAEVRRAVAAAGLELERCATHAAGGVLLEVVARRPRPQAGGPAGGP